MEDKIEKRDPNFVCRVCFGDIVLVREENGRKVYQCSTCQAGGDIYECIICHKPRTIWADDGNVCGLCFFDWQEGKIQLTEEQITSIRKWIVTIDAEKFLK